MLRVPGQAAVEFGRWLHWIGEVLLTLTLLAVVASGVLAWRLSNGPLELGFLRHRVEKAANKSISPLRLSFDDLSIAWRGFSHGLDQPLVFRMTRLTVEDETGAGKVTIPVVESTLSVRGLLSGWVLPRRVALEGAQIGLVRRSDGSFGFDMGGLKTPEGSGALTGLLAVLAAPAQSDLQAAAGRLSQLASVSIRNAGFSLNDIGTADNLAAPNLAAHRADLELTRHPGGGVDGAGSVSLDLSGETANLAVTFNLAASDVRASGRAGHGAAHVGPVTPKALAALAAALDPALAPATPMIAALDAPVTIDVASDIGPDFQPAHSRLEVRLGSGHYTLPHGRVPFRAGSFVLSGTIDQAVLESATVELRPDPSGPVARDPKAAAHPDAAAAITTARAHGTIGTRRDRFFAALHVTLDHAAMPDLKAMWPSDIARDLHEWIVPNVPAGIIHDGAVDLTLEGPLSGEDIDVTQAAGTMEISDASVIWMPRVPPVEHIQGHMTLTGPDAVTIDARSGRQTVREGDPLPVRSARVVITGLNVKDQDATIETEIAGSVASAISLLKEPGLRLLDRHPMDLKAPSGDAHVRLSAALPLKKDLDVADVTIHAAGELSKLHLGGIVSGQDLDDGAVLLDADMNHLTVKGTAKLAAIATHLDGQMDFRPGPPTQVVRRFTVAAGAPFRALAVFGLDAGDAVSGDVGLNVILSEYRNGDGDLAVKADLAATLLTMPPLAWRKPAGVAASVTGRVLLSNDKPTGVDRIAADGPGLQFRGAAAFTAGKLSGLRIDRALLGGTDVIGTIRLPADGSIAADLSGPSLDLSAKIVEKPTKHGAEKPGPAWSLRGRFDRVTLAHGHAATRVAARAEHDGTVFRALAVTATLDSGKPVSVQIEPGGKGRRLSISAADAGGLAHALDITASMRDGGMSVTGAYDDGAPGHPLSGVLEIADFRVTQAAGLGKLLQALTLYGLVDALGGPGLSFSQLTAPFRYMGDTIDVHDMRAFSPSLGLTAKGTIDQGTGRIDLEGTVVPAYLFNSLLGKLPLIGGLFSAEKGGGLLAMNYALRGPIDDPAVLANPLSALTPGILRNMFGLFPKLPLDQTPAEDKPPGP